MGGARTPRKSAKIIALAIVLLPLGAIVNFAVAWLIWALPMSSGGTFRVLTPGANEERWWSENAPAGFAQKPTGHVDRRYFGRMTTDLNVEQASGPNTPWIRNTAMRVRAGWPMHSMEGAVWSDPLGSIFHRRHLYYPPSGWPCSKWGLPCRPLGVGFAINSIVYAAILWLLLEAYCAIRRRRRIKRGLCPACAYPVGESAMCSECGKAVVLKRGMGT